MNSNNDVFGHEIWECYKGHDSYEIIEREDGYFGISRLGAIAYLQEYKEWWPHQKQAIKLAKGKVLDIGCGAGRHALYLQRKNLKVVAIDTSPLAIKVCKLRGVKDASVMGINQLNRFKKREFDTILMLGSNFGLFREKSYAKKALKRLSRITCDNALLIVESRDPHKSRGKVDREYHQSNVKRGRMPGQLRMRLRFKQYVSSWFDYLLVSKKEMKEVIRGSGWKITKFLDSKASPHGIYAAVLYKS